jgi:hypothetical protein
MLTTNARLETGFIGSPRVVQEQLAPAIDHKLISEEGVARAFSEAPALQATLSRNVIKVLALHAGRAIGGPLRVETSQDVIDEIRSQLESCRPSRIRNNGGQNLTVRPALRALIAKQPELEAYYRNHPTGCSEVVEAARTMPIAELLAYQGVKIEGKAIIVGEGAVISLNHVSPNSLVGIDGLLGFHIGLGPSHVSAVIDHDGQLLFGGAPSVELIRRSTIQG